MILDYYNDGLNLVSCLIEPVGFPSDGNNFMGWPFASEKEQGVAMLETLFLSFI